MIERGNETGRILTDENGNRWKVAFVVNPVTKHPQTGAAAFTADLVLQEREQSE